MKEFCLQLGAVLGKFPSKLLVESDDARTADRMVIDGLLASQRAPGTRIWVYHRTQWRSSPPFADEAAEYHDLFLWRPFPDIKVSSAHLRILRDADLAIVVGGGSDSYSAGLAASLMGVRLIPVATFGGAGRLLWQQLSDQFESPIVKLPLRDTWDRLASEWPDVTEAINEEVAGLPRLMIVHGRSNDRMVLEDILNTQDIKEPIVLQERFKPGQTIPEVFEREALQADAALVLFTPDDEASTLLNPAGEPLSSADLCKRARARQNVSLEYGWFWGRLGRDRVLLLMKGELELPSDLVGLRYESYTNSPSECMNSVVKFVERIRNR
jgi:predicted nucleotide-binding protein